MNIRETLEEREYAVLSPFAAKSRESRGRQVPEEPCDIRTDFQRDRDRILHCKAFRRMKHKTQVFLAPEGDHYRTRLTHTLEVAQISRTIARALSMNEDLTEAVALGHDLGHTPFGHAGEKVLNEIVKGGFSHERQSLRVVDRLEKNGEGLNLTFEVRNGIVNHRSDGHPATLEGKIVQLSDKIAYVNHDIDDAIRAGILTEDMLPQDCTAVLGRSIKERLDTMIHAVIFASAGRNGIAMTDDVYAAMSGLRDYMFDNLYKGSIAKVEEEKAKDLVRSLYDYYLTHFEECFGEEPRDSSREQAVCDYISGMTDDYAIHCFKELFVPKSWKY